MNLDSLDKLICVTMIPLGTLHSVLRGAMLSRRSLRLIWVLGIYFISSSPFQLLLMHLTLATGYDALSVKMVTDSVLKRRYNETCTNLIISDFLADDCGPLQLPDHIWTLADVIFNKNYWINLNTLHFVNSFSSLSKLND